MICLLCQRPLAGNSNSEQCWNPQCANFLKGCPTCGSGCISKDDTEAECFICGKFYFYYGPPVRGRMQLNVESPPTQNPLQVQQNYSPIASRTHQSQFSDTLLNPQGQQFFFSPPQQGSHSGLHHSSTVSPIHKLQFPDTSSNPQGQQFFFSPQQQGSHSNPFPVPYNPFLSHTPDAKGGSSAISTQQYTQLKEGSYPQIAFVDKKQRVTMSLGFLFDELEHDKQKTLFITPHYRVFIDFSPRNPTEQTGTASQYKILPTTYNQHLVGSHDIRRAFGGGMDRFNISPISQHTNSGAGKIGIFEKEVRELMKNTFETQITGTTNIMNTKNIFLQVTSTTYNPSEMMDYLFSKNDYNFIKQQAQEQNHGFFIEFINNLAAYLPYTQDRYLLHFTRDHVNSNLWNQPNYVLSCLLSSDDIMKGAASLDLPRYSRKNNVPHDANSYTRLYEKWKKSQQHDGTYYFFESDIKDKYFLNNTRLFFDISDYISLDRPDVNILSQSINDATSYDAYLSKVKNLTKKYFSKNFSIKRVEDWIDKNNIIEGKTRYGKAQTNTNKNIETNEKPD